MQCTEVTNTFVLNFRRNTEVSRNLQETSGEVRKSYATCGKPNAVAGGYKHFCFTLPANDGRFTQLAGNQMQFLDYVILRQ
ncbi:hypothetical protein [Chryseobacterium taichungense]|uniref:hypothetical protein n=1 Tax=Chryseobacterium taichungense TaxID=295069 RepID=UPI0028AA242B|nr:hypothetical protein [Chryseobacterium taichungense]